MHKTNEYDIVFSLGEACLCATMLKNLGLRHFSSPFDWLYGSDFRRRVDLLYNDFDGFLNKEDLQLIGQRENPEPCDVYYNQSTDITLNHDFPINGIFDATFPKVKVKYNRRIDNLLTSIKKSKKVLIVFMELKDSISGSLSDDEIIALMDKVNRKFAPVKVDLIYIRHNPDMKDGEFTIKELDERIKLAQCFNYGRGETAEIPGNFANAKLILSGIICKRDWKKSLQYYFYVISKKLMRLVYRHKYRNGKEIIRILGITVKTKVS